MGALLCIGASVRVDCVFERRFRDIHTLSQQIQSRDAHYETVGRVLLGTPPEVFLKINAGGGAGGLHDQTRPARKGNSE